ncbi:MAG: rod shape-determining protein MreD [Pseudomonadota bacterium]
MAERPVTYLWAMRLLFLALSGLIMFLHLLPLEPVSRFWAAPDLMIALTFAWVLRRPEFAPLVLIAGVFLLADFLLQRPPGLWSALVLIGSFTLRSKALDLRDLTFSMEWLSVASTLIAITLAYRIILALLVVDTPPLSLTLVQLLMTLIAYPFVVLASQTIFRVRKIAPGEIDAMRNA